MTTATAVRCTPLDVIRTAAVVITARGYYQPASRQWEEMVPTVMDVEALLCGYPTSQRGDAALFARTASQMPPTVSAAVLEWARNGTAEHGNYRAKLARAAHADYADRRDLALLVSAVEVWQRERTRAARATQAATDARLSRHQGERGERLVRTATVAAVIEQKPRTYGYRVQERRLVKFRDDHGHIYVWPASVQNPATLPPQGACITFSGTVTKHDTYRNERHGDVAQTYVNNCRWKHAA